MNTYDIVPTRLVVKAMRDSGYKNAAYAIAELMDNSIQADASNVELLCAERVERVRQRSRSRISEIAVLDNGCGMDAETLQMALQFGNGTRLDDFSGIGRFGMGLPNSSISQARCVDVWSWQNGPESAIHTYIDLDKIESGVLQQVPVPKSQPIPEIWREVGRVFDRTGTLVVWSNLDRILWRTARAIIDNSELLIGRIYRYFLADGRVQIRFVSFDLDDPQPQIERDALPNDPLYLLSRTSCPEPWDNTPMFTQAEYQNTPFTIRFNGEEHTVIVRFAYAKEEARKGYNPGSTRYGRHAAKNVGVSIVRAGREIDLDPSWSDPSNPRDRWWGVEVRFPPALDDLVGVTNNKQAARNFSNLAQVDLESFLEEGQTLGAVKEVLDADQDPRLPLLEIAQHIRSNINTIRRLIRAQTATPKRQRHQGSHSEEKGTEVTRKRVAEGHQGTSDIQEERQTYEERQKEISKELEEQGATHENAEELAAQTVGHGLKYKIIESSVNSPAFFDVKPRGGAVIISLNVDHPAYEHLVELLQSDVDGADENDLRTRLLRARNGLELLLMAWARYEDEQPDGPLREKAQDARWDWGRLAREFLRDD